MMEAAVELGYVVGLDLGKLNDFTAIAVMRQLEQVEVVDEQERQRALERMLAGVNRVFSRALPRLGAVKGRNVHFELVHLDRVPLGTSYPTIVAQVAELMHRLPLRGKARLVVDSTGVGV